VATGCSLTHKLQFCLLMSEFVDVVGVVDLMGEGRVDLNVGFTFSLLFQVFHGRRRDCRTNSYLDGGGTP